MTDERPSFDEWFIEMAQIVAKRGDCLRRTIGSILVRPDRTVCAIGYNGTTPGAKGCLEGACPRGHQSLEDVPPLSDYSPGSVGECISLHAEQNCLSFARENTRGYTLYITNEPCYMCIKVIKAHRLKRVVYLNEQNQMCSLQFGW